jgi:hypothetical protein
VLLIAERAAMLSGRDDEFVAVVLKAFTGMRWDELVGLEPQYVRPTGIRIEWQLYELDTSVLHRCPPKEDSYRTIYVPGRRPRLVSDHIASTRPKACPCHGLKYVASGHRPPTMRPVPIGALGTTSWTCRSASQRTVKAMTRRPLGMTGAAPDYQVGGRFGIAGLHGHGAGALLRVADVLMSVEVVHAQMVISPHDLERPVRISNAAKRRYRRCDAGRTSQLVVSGR